MVTNVITPILMMQNLLFVMKREREKLMCLKNIGFLMSVEQIRESEKYTEDGIDRYEFTEMFQDFLSIVD